MRFLCCPGWSLQGDAAAVRMKPESLEVNFHYAFRDIAGIASNIHAEVILRKVSRYTP